MHGLSLAPGKYLVAAAADDGVKAVKGEVETHKNVWLARGKEERTMLGAQAAISATRPAGHQVDCQACTSDPLVVGDPIPAPILRFNLGEISETQE